MASPIICSECGYAGGADDSVCVNCGATLRRGDAPLPRRTAPPAVYLGRRPWNYALWRDLDRTQLGLGALFLGVVGGWVGGLMPGLPLLAVLAGAVFLFGAVLVFLGRAVFGPRHRTFAAAGLAILGLVFVASIFVVGNFSSGLTSALASSSNGYGPYVTATSFSGAINTLLDVVAALGVLSVLGSVLLVHELEPVEGKAFLWAAVGAAALILGAMVVDVGAAISEAASSAFTASGVDPSPILAAGQEVFGFQAAMLVPVAMLASLFLVARARIEKGKVPRRSGEDIGAAAED